MVEIIHTRIRRRASWLGVRGWVFLALLLGAKNATAQDGSAPSHVPDDSLSEIEVVSSLDGKPQPILFHLHRATAVPIDIAAGVHDGHTGSVPIRHSLEAFNVLAWANGDQPITQSEMKQLSDDRALKAPRASDQVSDSGFGRQIHLRRHSGNARVTIFEGGHEGLARPACEWLSGQVRDTRR